MKGKEEEKMRVEDAIDFLMEERVRQQADEVEGKITTRVHDCQAAKMKSGYVLFEGGYADMLDIDDWLLRQIVIKMETACENGTLKFRMEVA